MKLSDIVGASGLSSYAEIALVLFLLAFLAVVVSLFLPSRQRTYERMRHLPMDRDSADTSAQQKGPYRDVCDSSPSARNDTALDREDCESPLVSPARNDNHA